MLVVRGLSKAYAGARPRTVFAAVDLELQPGDYVAVMGESGIGKSTLLNLIAGLDRADRGSIQLDGVELTTLDDDALTTAAPAKPRLRLPGLPPAALLERGAERRLAPDTSGRRGRSMRALG